MTSLFSQGVQFVFDRHQDFVKAGLPVYLRVANFTKADEGDSFEVGVPFSPSGTYDTDFTDILIQPPPYVKDMSSHDLGFYGGRYNVGTRIFKISNTFVQLQLKQDSFKAANVTDPYEVFRNRDGKAAIGIYYNSRLFSIGDITHNEVAGGTITWKVIGAAEEIPTTVQGGP